MTPVASVLTSPLLYFEIVLTYFGRPFSVSVPLYVTECWSNSDRSQIKSSAILRSSFALIDCPKIFFLSRLYFASSIDDLHFMDYSFILSEGCNLICYIFRGKINSNAFLVIQYSFIMETEQEKEKETKPTCIQR